MNTVAWDITLVSWFVDVDSIAEILVGIQALAATIGLFCGVAVVVRRRTTIRSPVVSVYLWSLVAMVLFLGGAMLLRWPAYASVERISFSALLVLAFYLIRRAYSATVRIESGENTLDPTAVHHIGFTLIALFEGFIIVALLNLRIDGWIVGGVAIAVVVLGRRIIERVVARDRQRTLGVESEGWVEGPIDHR